MRIRWSLPLAFTLTLAACANPPKAPEPATPPMTVAVPAAPTLGSGLLPDNFDRNVRPQDDFYRFVNGTWLAKTQIPADKSNYGAFGALEVEAEKNLRTITEEAAKANAPLGSDQQLIGDFYTSYMDEAKVESLGLAPLQPELDRIAAIKDRPQLQAYLAAAQLRGVDNPVGGDIFSDS
jgi:predicted metalloendopeptidase